jgi:TPR repeat protein
MALMNLLLRALCEISEILVVTKSYYFKGICLVPLCLEATAQNVSTPQPITADAQVRLGNDYLAQKDYSSAMIWFRKGAERNDPAAENNIGWLYENGLGIAKDYAEAMNWFRRAANQGYGEAQNNIGWLLQNGWGVKQDYGEAMTWYRKAADQGNMRASTNIGFLLQQRARSQTRLFRGSDLVPDSCRAWEC